MLLSVLRQLRHWMEMRVALARTPVAEMTIPGIFTRCDIMSDCNRATDRVVGSRETGTVGIMVKISFSGAPSQLSRTCDS